MPPRSDDAINAVGTFQNSPPKQEAGGVAGKMAAASKGEIPHLISPADLGDGSSSDDGSTRTHTAIEASSPVRPPSPSGITNEDEMCYALGISMLPPGTPGLGGTEPEKLLEKGDGAEETGAAADDLHYNIVPNPEADEVDLSVLRGTRAPVSAQEKMRAVYDEENEEDLEALAELVPGLKERASPHHVEGGSVMNTGVVYDSHDGDFKIGSDDPNFSHPKKLSPKEDENNGNANSDGMDKNLTGKRNAVSSNIVGKNSIAQHNPHHPNVDNLDSMRVQRSLDDDDEENNRNKRGAAVATARVRGGGSAGKGKAPDLSDGEDDESSSSESSSDSSMEARDQGRTSSFEEEQNLGGFYGDNNDSSDGARRSTSSDERDTKTYGQESRQRMGPRPIKTHSMAEDYRSSASLSTATQTQEVRMPMYLPTFKPATGCTNASDFIVRCFVARLRAGITVVKHGRSRWCKSRLRILHVHSDGRSLTWKPALGEPTSSKRPPKLDLSTCMEVRHAWSPDPLNPMFTGTPILRQKCEAANAHKSFALIFPKRTVDITAVTADQCKVLMEGFSALCFRLQVANLAGRGGKKSRPGEARGVGEEEDGTTASVTLTNNSTTISPSGSGGGRQKRSNYHR